VDRQKSGSILDVELKGNEGIHKFHPEPACPASRPGPARAIQSRVRDTRQNKTTTIGFLHFWPDLEVVRVQVRQIPRSNQHCRSRQVLKQMFCSASGNIPTYFMCRSKPICTTILSHQPSRFKCQSCGE